MATSTATRPSRSAASKAPTATNKVSPARTGRKPAVKAPARKATSKAAPAKVAAQPARNAVKAAPAKAPVTRNAVKAAPVRFDLVAVGPMSRGPAMHVHSADCADRNKPSYKEFQAEWDDVMAMGSFQELVELIYEAHMEENGHQTGKGASDWEKYYAQEFKLFPCVPANLPTHIGGVKPAVQPAVKATPAPAAKTETKPVPVKVKVEDTWGFRPVKASALTVGMMVLGQPLSDNQDDVFLVTEVGARADKKGVPQVYLKFDKVVGGSKDVFDPKAVRGATYPAASMFNKITIR